MSMRDWFGKERRKRDIVYLSVVHELSESTQSLLEQLIEAVKDRGSSESLQEVLNRITNLGVEHSASRTEIGMILSLLQGEAQQKLDEFAQRINQSSDQVEDKIEQQTKGDR